MSTSKKQNSSYQQVLLTDLRSSSSRIDKAKMAAAASSLKQPQFCKVCGAPAGKHIYYGARTCISCRGFFRRSVQSRQFKAFACISTLLSCPVDSKSRKSCKKCRFEKCLEIGMKVSWVLSEEERCQRMMQRLFCLSPAHHY